MITYRTLRWLPGALAAGLLAAGCAAAPPLSPGELRLVAFESCDEVLRGLRTAAQAHVGPYGLPGQAVPLPAISTTREQGRAAAMRESATSAPGTDTAMAQDYRGTIVHESGVDEPDLVKTDGRRIVTVTNGRLRVIDAARREVTGTLDLTDDEWDEGGDWWRPADLLLHGDRALVLLGPAWWGGIPAPAPALPEPALPEPALPEPVLPVEPALPDGAGAAPAAPADVGPDASVSDSDSRDSDSRDSDSRDPDTAVSAAPALVEPAGPAAPAAPAVPARPVPPTEIVGPRLMLVELADAPRVVGEYTMDGELVDARAVGGVVRVVVRSGPRLTFPMPEVTAVDPAGRLADEDRWIAAHRAVIESAELADWLPRYQVREGDATDAGQVGCAAVSHPPTYSGTSLLTVLTFDLAAPSLGDGQPVSVVADGDTVYSNGTSLYVASDQRRITDPEAGAMDQRTEIYKFDVSEPGPPRYTAAGAVPGWLLNQYALSEWQEHLRVATTTGEAWGEDADSESAVYALAERDGELVEVGSVGGLGRTERIHSVRFVGPTGYVVTFRQTDPLYTVDLSDPAAPRVRGELEITGYSAYLHPIADGRLIGVGQAADQAGSTLGTQVSLFDVADLTSPTLLATHHVPGGHSEVEHDPHAFQWWPDDQLLMIPLTIPVLSGDRTGPPPGSVLLLEVEDAGFTERGQISHPEPEPDIWRSSQIRRSLVVNDTLWTISDTGLQANSLSTLDRTAWVPLA